MKTRMNIYIKNTNREKLHDVQYTYRKKRKLKKNIPYSEIINRLLERLNIKKIIGILNGK